MNRQIGIAPVRKSVQVAATPERAFEVFTARLDSWWPKTHGIGKATSWQSILEPYVGGRWYERGNDGVDTVVGHVLVWQPPERFVVSWEISADWKPDGRAAFASEVDVRFIREAGGTRIDLEHRNFERMGESGRKMHDDVERGWPGILDRYAKALTPRST